MPKGELVCEGCGQYESECMCDIPLARVWNEGGTAGVATGANKPAESSRGCSFCGNAMTLLMQNREYRLWACQPLKGREGCGRLLLEDAREGLGATWYYAEQNEPDRRRL